MTRTEIKPHTVSGVGQTALHLAGHQLSTDFDHFQMIEDGFPCHASVPRRRSGTESHRAICDLLPFGGRLFAFADHEAPAHRQGRQFDVVTLPVVMGPGQTPPILV